MLFIRHKRSTIVSIPNLALMLLGWVVCAVVTTLVNGKPFDLKYFGGLALAIAVVLILGAKTVRRQNEMIFVTNLLRTKGVLARHAFLGVVMRSHGRFGGFELEVMPTSHFEPNPTLNKALPIESFLSTGINYPMRIARRAALALELPEPLVSPWLVDDSVRGTTSSSNTQTQSPRPAEGPPVVLLKPWREWTPRAQVLLVIGLCCLGWEIWTLITR